VTEKNPALRDRITSIGIIPELTCDKTCVHCYEKKKSYGKKMSDDAFFTFVVNTLNRFPNRNEVMIDMNQYSVAGKLVENIIDHIHSEEHTAIKRVLITCNASNYAPSLIEQDHVKVSVSVHSHEDLRLFLEYYGEIGDKLEGVSLMGDDYHQYYVPLMERDIPIYVNFNKFPETEDWRDVVWSKHVPLLIHMGKESIEIDNCLATQIHKQECPAWTQVNIYADGSMRYCPYATEDQTYVSTDVFKSGCFLVTKKEQEEGNARS